MKSCPVCHFENEDTAVVCAQCQSPLSQDQGAQWFFIDGLNAKGPYSYQDMTALMEDGTLTPTHYVWKNGFPDWIFLEQSELMDYLRNKQAKAQQAQAIELTLEKQPQSSAAQASVQNPTDQAQSGQSQSGQPAAQENVQPIQEQPEVQWYYIENGKSSSPVSQDELLNLIRNGTLNMDSYVWREPFKEWVRIRDTELVQQLETVKDQPIHIDVHVAARSIPLFIFLSLITCGLFSFVWFYLIAESTRTLSKEVLKKPMMPALNVLLLSLVTCGIFGIYYQWKMAQRLSQITRTDGAYSIIVLVGAVIFPLISYSILQDEINSIVSGEEAVNA